MTTPVLRIAREQRDAVEDQVVVEYPLTVIVNGQQMATMLCSPAKLEYLAVGFLAAEGLVSTKDDIERVRFDEEKSAVEIDITGNPALSTGYDFGRFITATSAKGAVVHSFADGMNQARVESEITFAPSHFFTLMEDFQSRSAIFKVTGGVHSAALADSEHIILFSEDIGRHNAVDKVFGECLLENIPAQDRILLISGRVSSEILFKIARRKVPIIVSRSAPTNLAIRAANYLGITLIGFVRGQRMNVYANDWRIE